MNVTGGGTKLLFCEGEPASLDYRLLSRLLRGRPPTTLIVPSGGKQGLRSFIRGRLEGYSTPPSYVAFRDRDFDAEPPAAVALISPLPGRPVFLTHRAAIENYLLDAALIDSYWTTLSQSAPNWNHGDSPGVADIRCWIDAAAKVLTNYQAVRWSLSSLKPGDRWPELSTTWTEGSGSLPANLDVDDCLTNAKQLVDDYRTETSGISVEDLLEQYQRFSSLFADPAFFDRADYLIWFHGKDLRKSMQKLRQNSISLQHFSGWAVEHIDWNQHADLRQLAASV